MFRRLNLSTESSTFTNTIISLVVKKKIWVILSSYSAFYPLTLVTEAAVLLPVTVNLIIYFPLPGPIMEKKR
jgi:hypothetical protein